MSSNEIEYESYCVKLEQSKINVLSRFLQMGYPQAIDEIFALGKMIDDAQASLMFHKKQLDKLQNAEERK